MGGAVRWGLLLVALAVAGACGALAPAADATLSVPGATALPPFTGTGASGVGNTLAAFEAATGGADNGTTVGEQSSGFRHLTWDGLTVDGSDPTSRTIEPGHVVGLGSGRLEPWGIAQAPGVAVANDGFRSANNSVAFTPFTPQSVWAPYNSDTAEFDVVAPAAVGSLPVPAQTRGLGIVFLNVTTTDTTIRYYNGDILLGKVSVPIPASVGAPSFAGLLFPAAVVTRVVITLGTAAIFAFDGSIVTPTQPAANDFVVGDDLVLAEPSPTRGDVAATAGVPVTAALDTFIETSPNATIRAVIDWGDGTRTAGTISPGPGGTVEVTGNHAYAQTGDYTTEVTVNDFGGPEQSKQTDVSVGPRASVTSVTCSPSPVAVSAATTCTATVADVGGALTPSGLVSFSTSTPGASFGQDGGCLLGPTAIPGVSVCSVGFTPGQLPPRQARAVAIYGGDGAHSGSGGTATVGVRAQRCSVRALTRRLRRAGLGLLVTCDARANVRISVTAVGRRTGALRPFQLQFGSLRALVTEGRPTVLVVRPARGVLPILRIALSQHQHVSLKLALTASSHVTRRTTTTRVAAVRIL
jgi:hypothetical protein